MEYLDGQAYPMPGATVRDCRINTNVVYPLRCELEGKGFEVFGADIRIRAGSSGLYTHPDCVVVAGEAEIQHESILNPVLLVEVLSPSSNDYDHASKFEAYRQIASFSEYLVVAQDRVYVEHYIREAESWTLKIFSDLNSITHLQSVPAQLALQSVYQNVRGIVGV